MTGKTHKMGGMFISVLGFALLKNNNMLMENVNLGLQWLTIYPFCVWGSTASDLDHHWQSCPTKDLPSLVVHKILHFAEPRYKQLDASLSKRQKDASIEYKVCKVATAKHRSWQTHSDLTLLLMLYLLFNVIHGKFDFFNSYDAMLARLILTGLCMGVAEHLILDLLTTDGIWNMTVVILNILLGGKIPRKFEKWHFVPRMHFFATDSKWEHFIYKLLKVLTVVSVVYLLLIVLCPDFIIKLQGLFPYRLKFNY